MSRITDIFPHIFSAVAWGNVFGFKNMIRSLRIGGDTWVRQTTCRWTNMTNFENGCVACIDSVMQHNAYEDTIADVIDIPQCCHFLVVAWAILYDQPKPLK
jgi:hypothetical protein